VPYERKGPRNTHSGRGSSRSSSGQVRSRRSVIGAAELQRPDRRRDILASAELLFSVRGYAAVSVRDIALRANVPIALVGYYFGRKHELFLTIFEHRKASISARIDRIKAVKPIPNDARLVEHLVRAWAEPVIEQRSNESGEAFSLLVARTMWDPAPEASKAIDRYYDPLARVFIAALCKIFPGCSRHRILWTYEYAVGALLTHIADRRIERLSDGDLKSGDPLASEGLYQFITSGICALVLPSTRSAEVRPAAAKSPGKTARAGTLSVEGARKKKASRRKMRTAI